MLWSHISSWLGKHTWHSYILQFFFPAAMFFTEPRSNQSHPCQQLTYSLTDSCLVDLTWLIGLWLIRMAAECLLIVIILNLNFVPDFEAEVWSRFWCWVFIKLLGEALTLVRTLSPLVHCAFAMFLFGSLVSLAMLLFWRLYIKQADESALKRRPAQ